MTIDEALRIVLDKLDAVMIPAKESAKIEEIKGDIRTVIDFVKQERQKAAEKKKEAKENEA